MTGVSHYRIVEKLGEGGMGEVYRATDTRLGRDVAIKRLSAALARDADYVARFQREAHVLASLSHPNIAVIYDIEDFEGASVLVMELVEGPTLAERISQGPIPLNEALPIARQIAEALEAAHEHGVVHRDLKPANIKITSEGQVKVLDFGLAKAAEQAAGADPANSPTITMRATQAGVIVGTAAYMAPEQAAGKPVDKRADIWAYGVVLWEMLTGRSLFEGETIAHTLADVLRGEIDFGALPAGTPTAVRTIVRRCLDRKLKTRLRDIGEARISIDEYLANPAAAEPEKRTEARPRKPLAWIVAGALGLVAATQALIHLREAPAELPMVRFTIGPPERTVFGSSGTVSPDGRRVVFRAGADGKYQLWVRSLDTIAAQALAGTERAMDPFWSPDSRSIGFGADGKLKKIDANGGPALTLADAPNFRGGTWNRDGLILFSPGDSGGGGGPLRTVSAAGGASREATKLDQAKGESAHRFPWFLPDGRHFLVASMVQSSNRLTIRIGSLDSPESKILLEANSNAMYAASHLLYVRDSTLMAQPFDPKRLATQGDAVPLAENVLRTYASNATLGAFSVSESGVLTYATGEPNTMRLTWFNREGKRLSTVGDPAALGRVHLSRGRNVAAVAVTERNNTDIWLYDLQRGLRTRSTFDPAQEVEAIWSPDDRTIVFGSNREGHSGLYRKSAEGTGAEELLYSDDLNKNPTSWSPDGRFVLYTASSLKTGYDIWVLPMTPDRAGTPLKPYPWLQTDFNEASAQFSPDGKWVSYQSNESGRPEIYVASFPGPGGRRQVSTAGGVQPRWRGDGNEIFSVGPDGKLMGVEVNARGTTMEIGQTHPLFGDLVTGQGFLYDASADGQRFLAVVPPEERTDSAANAFTILQNWAAGLNK